MQQQVLFDGFSVEKQKGVVTGFDIEPDDMENYRADDVLVLVMTATVVGGSFKQNASGDWVRTNALKSHQVRVANGVMKDEIVEFFNLAGDELPFSRPGAARAVGNPVGAPVAPAAPSQAPATTGVQAGGQTPITDDPGISDPALAEFLSETA